MCFSYMRHGQEERKEKLEQDQIGTQVQIKDNCLPRTRNHLSYKTLCLQIQGAYQLLLFFLNSEAQQEKGAVNTAALNLATENCPVLDSKMGRKQNCKGRRKCTLSKTLNAFRDQCIFLETAVFQRKNMRVFCFEVGHCSQMCYSYFPKCSKPVVHQSLPRFRQNLSGSPIHCAERLLLILQKGNWHLCNYQGQ